MVLDNRELASVIWLTVAAVLVLVLPRFQVHTKRILGIIRSDVRIVLSFLLLGAWSGLLVGIAASVGYRYPELIKDAAIVVVTVGFPLMVNLISALSSFARERRPIDGPGILRRTAKETLSIAALVFAYLNLAPFPLWVEMLLVPVLIALYGMRLTAATRPEWEPVGKLLTAMLAIIGVGVASWVTAQIVLTAGSFDWLPVLFELLLGIWLPFAMFPYLYLVLFLVAAEVATVWIRKIRKPPALKRVALAAVLGLHLRIRWANAFRWGLMQGYDRKVGATTSFRDAVREMRDFRDDVRNRGDQEVERLAHLEASTGQSGADGTGAQLDRREFQETKHALERIEVSQMGRFNSSGAYWGGPERADAVLDPFGRCGLPVDHGVQVEVSASGRVWRAWRKTPNGWHLGIGGRDGGPSTFHYAAQHAPSDWPGDPGWTDDTYEPEYIPDWQRNDEPII